MIPTETISVMGVGEMKDNGGGGAFKSDKFDTL
jgi:hypothetical protein